MRFLSVSAAIAISAAAFVTANPLHHQGIVNHARDFFKPTPTKLNLVAEPSKTKFEVKAGSAEYEVEAKPTDSELEFAGDQADVEIKAKPTETVIQIKSGTVSTELHATPAATRTPSPLPLGIFGHTHQ